jgi:hypothetical protein
VSLLDRPSPVDSASPCLHELEDAFHAWADDPAEPGLAKLTPPPSRDVAPATEPPRPADGSPRADIEDLRRVVILTSAVSETIDTLLLLVAHGDEDAFATLQDRMVGLVLVNVRRVLRDAARSDAVTQQSFADLAQDALDFDPHHDTARDWLLARAHQHAMARLHALDTTTDNHDPISDRPVAIPILTL